MEGGLQFFVNERLLHLASDPSTILFHPHSARTGGRTFRMLVLNKVFGAEHVYCRQNVPGWKSWRDLADQDLKGYRAYTDLRDFEVINISRPVAGIAVLRDPLYRIVSLYGFSKGNRDHRHHDQAQRYPLEEFYRVASGEHPKYFHNVQCRRVCGQADAALAMDFLRKQYIAAGFTNHLAEYTRLLCSMFKWPDVELESVGPDAARYESMITPEFRQTVLKDNQHDQALFEAVVEQRVWSAPGAWFGKRFYFLSGWASSVERTRSDVSTFFRAHFGKKKKKQRLTQEQKKRMRRFDRTVARLERTKEISHSAPPGTVVCNVCGTSQSPATAPVKNACPSCRAKDHERMFVNFFEARLGTYLDAGEWGDAMIFATEGVERNLLEASFDAVTIPTLVNNYGRPTKQAAPDMTTLAPYGDHAFDFVQMSGELCEASDAGAAVRSLHRVLTPRGAFCFYTGRPDGRRAQLASAIAATGLSCETFDLVDPVTGQEGIWWLCRKSGEASGEVSDEVSNGADADD